MKIKRISLSQNEYYGHFSGCDFEFDTENLVVVYGPNESGKSTFLNLVRDLLFGIRTNPPYAFAGASQKMQMNATLELQDAVAGNASRRLEMTRRKGKKNALTGRFEDGETIDEAYFKKLLNLPDRGEYENVFGFTQAILSSDLRSDKGGSLAQLLYSTAFRAGGVTELKKQLRDESERYFAPQGRTKILNTDVGRIESLLDELERSRVDRNRYVELEKRLESHAQEIAQLEKILTGKEKEKRQLAKLQKSRQDYLSLKRNRMRLRQIDESNDLALRFPVDGKTEYQNLSVAIAESQNSIDENAKSVAQATMQIELQKCQCRKDILNIGASLQRLANRKSGYASQMQRLSELHESIETIEQNIETLLKRLAPNAKLETTVERTVTDAMLAELESLQKQARDVSQEMIGYKSRLKLLQSQLTERENQLKKLVATSADDTIGKDDRQRITLLSLGCSQYEINCEQLRDQETMQIELAEKIKETSLKLARKLGIDESVFSGDDPSYDLPLFRQFPDENVIREYDGEFDLLRKSLNELDRQLVDYAEKLSQCKLEIAKLDSGNERPPTKEDVRKERENRDRVWRHFRGRYFGAAERSLRPNESKSPKNGGDVTPDAVPDELPTPEFYEQLVKGADKMADLRFDRVNDVRRLEELFKEYESHSQRMKYLQKERQTAQERLDGITFEWLALWPGCDAGFVKRPASLYETRRDWDEWQRLRQQLREMASKVVRLQSQKAEFERQAGELAAKFPNIGTFGRTLPKGEIIWDVTEMQALCQSLKNAADRQAEYQRQAVEYRDQVATARSDIESMQNAMTAANERLAEIGRRTQRQAKEIGLFDDENDAKAMAAPNIPTEQAIEETLARLLNGCELVRRIQQEHRNYRREGKQLQEIESQVRQFEDDAKATLQTVAWDEGVASLAPVELLAHALTLLEHSEKAMIESQTCEAQLAMLHNIDQLEREKCKKRQADLQTLIEKAGVADGEMFMQLAALADERCQCVAQITHSESRLLTILETTDLASWENELERRFGDRTAHAADGDADASQNAESQIRHPSNETSDLDGLLEKLEAETEQLREKIAQLRKEEGGTERDLKNLQQTDGAAAIAERVEYARQELFENVNRFVPRMLALRTLEHAIEKFEREQQPETLKQIQEYFAAMTGGRYTHVGTRISGDGNLIVSENDGKIKTVEQLSTGTREQLHLAVRLAYISNFCKTREPLPIVLDDVLVNFDPLRQVETLRFLGELSKQMQIIFLTCHEATLKLARETVPTLSMISL